MNNLIEQNSKEHKEIRELIAEINQKLEEAFVTQKEFEPYRWAVKIAGAVFITGLIAGLANLIITHQIKF